jgi:replicative DNA helicase
MTATETALVGLVLSRPALLPDVATQLAGTDFADPQLATIYEAALRLLDAGRQVDVAAIKDSPGVVADAVKHAADNAGGRTRIGEYVAEIRTAARLRKIAASAKLAATHAGQPGANADTIAADLIDALSSDDSDAGPMPISACVRDSYADLHAAVARNGRRAGHATGLEDYDRLVGGLVPGAMTVVAGRPGMGKTALAVDMMRGAARAGAHCLLVELEMGYIEVVTRMLCAEARVDADAMARGKGTVQDWRDVGHACERLDPLPIHVWCPKRDVTPATLRSTVRRQQQRGPLDVVVLDYIGLMSLPRQRGQSREEVVSAASRDFKTMCVTHGVAGVLISQLNRGVEARADKRPMLSDLRESGALEQDADVVTLVYRREYYEPQNKDVRGLAELIVAKHRNGPIGDVQVAWSGKSSSFANLASTP